MNKFGVLILSILLFTVSSCKKEKDNLVDHTTLADSINNESLTENNIDSLNTESPFILEAFDQIEEVQNCSCYFAKNKEDYQNKKFIYADDYGNNAFIKVNGQKISIKLEEGDFDLDEFDRQLETKDYLIEMSGQQKDNNTGKMIFEGRINVTNKATGEKSISSLYGECNC